MPPRLEVEMRNPAGDPPTVPVAVMRHEVAAGHVAWPREATVPAPLGTVSECQVSELLALMVKVKMIGVPALFPMPTQVPIDGQTSWVSAETVLAPLRGNSAVSGPAVPPQRSSAPEGRAGCPRAHHQALGGGRTSDRRE